MMTPPLHPAGAHPPPLSTPAGAYLGRRDAGPASVPAAAPPAAPPASPASQVAPSPAPAASAPSHPDQAAPASPATPGCPAPSATPGAPAPAAARRPGLVDGIDQRLLAELEHDGRASVRDLAARVHISRANAYARVRRLVEDGVIERFTTQVSPEHVGLTTSAYVSLRVQQNAWREMRDQLRSIPGVEHVALCSGDFDVVVLVRTTDTASLRDLVLDDIRSIPGVVDSRTVLLLDEVRGPGVRLPEAPTLE